VWPAIEAHCCYVFDGDPDALVHNVRVVAGAEAPTSPRDVDVVHYARAAAGDSRDPVAFHDGIAHDAWLRWTHARLLGHHPEFWPGMIKPTNYAPGGALGFARTRSRLAAGTLQTMSTILTNGLPPGGWRAILTVVAIVKIHPFFNGNKRLARYAANRDLAAAGLMPIVNVPAADRLLLGFTASAWNTGDALELAELLASASRQAATLDAAWAGREPA
jgi:hypothetical protein